MTGGGVLALDIGGTKLAAGVGHPGGDITREAGAPTLAGRGADDVLGRAIALARRCYDEELAAGGRIESMGVSTMGLTRPGHVSMAPNVPGWDQLDIPGTLDSAFPGLPVVIGNDVKLATQAELAWGSLRGADSGLYLNLGTGIAAGIVAAGRIVSGAHGAAGEIGYSLFRGRPEARMAAEGAAPFEEWFGGAGAARRLAGTGLPTTVAEVAGQREHDPSARDFLDELWTGIAVLAANLCIATDPAILSVGGGYLRGGPGLVDRLREVVARAVPYPPEVVAATFGADASLRGAVAAALTTAGAPS